MGRKTFRLYRKRFLSSSKVRPSYFDYSSVIFRNAAFNVQLTSAIKNVLLTSHNKSAPRFGIILLLPAQVKLEWALPFLAATFLELDKFL